MVSLYPCERHGRRMPQALESVRVSTLSGGSGYTRRMRLCAAHVDELLTERQSQWELVSDDGLEDHPRMCAACGSPAEASANVVSCFVHVYRKKQEPSQYFAQYCEVDALALIAAYGLLPQESRGGDLP